LNVSDTGETIPSVVLELSKSILTSAVGWLLSVTSNVAVPPDSVVINPDAGLTVIPAGVADGVGVGGTGVGAEIGDIGVRVGV
jgi:hypothetical protein